LLPRLIGLTRANDLLLSSRVFLTDEAMELGLLNGLFPKDELLPRTYTWVRELIARVSPESVAATKRQIYTDLHRDVGSSVAEAGTLLAAMMKQPDYAEAVAAWKEKRPPRWRGE
jgi:enoyl-CoA hydratase/carnithine racemase